MINNHHSENSKLNNYNDNDNNVLELEKNKKTNKNTHFKNIQEEWVNIHQLNDDVPPPTHKIIHKSFNDTNNDLTISDIDDDENNVDIQPIKSKKNLNTFDNDLTIELNEDKTEQHSNHIINNKNKAQYNKNTDNDIDEDEDDDDYSGVDINEITSANLGYSTQEMEKLNNIVANMKPVLKEYGLTLSKDKIALNNINKEENSFNPLNLNLFIWFWKYVAIISISFCFLKAILVGYKKILKNNQK